MYHLLCCVRYKKYSAFIEVVIGNTSAVCNIFFGNRVDEWPNATNNS